MDVLFFFLPPPPLYFRCCQNSSNCLSLCCDAFLTWLNCLLSSYQNFLFSHLGAQLWAGKENFLIRNRQILDLAKISLFSLARSFIAVILFFLFLSLPYYFFLLNVCYSNFFLLSLFAKKTETFWRPTFLERERDQQLSRQHPPSFSLILIFSPLLFFLSVFLYIYFSFFVPLLSLPSQNSITHRFFLFFLCRMQPSSSLLIHHP